MSVTDTSMLKAPVGPKLRSMALPVGVGMLSTFLFQVIDTYFVGQLGPEALAALGFASTAYFLLVSLFMGLSVAVSGLVGHAVGRSDSLGAQRYASVSLLLAAVMAIICTILGTLTIEGLFSLLGAEAELLPLIEDYLAVIYLGLPLLVVGLVGGAALRATGMLKAPELLMAGAGVVNLVLDYLLIFGVGPFPELGIKGAAWATVLSWALVGIGSSLLLVKRELLTTRWSDVSQVLSEIRKIAVPAVAAQGLLPLTAMLVTSLIARSSPQAVAAFGVAQRLETLLLVGISGMSVALIPFVAQNHGAQKLLRLKQAEASAGKTSVYWGLAVCILLVAGAEPIAAAFSDSSEVKKYIKLYFYLVSGSYFAHGLVMMATSLFNGLQQPQEALRILLVKSLGLTIPGALIGAFFGVEGIFLGLTLSNLAGALYAGLRIKRQLHREDPQDFGQQVKADYLSDGRRLLGWGAGLGRSQSESSGK